MQANPFTEEIVNRLQGQPGNPLTQVWAYTYGTDTMTVAQNARGSKNIDVDSETDFFIQRIGLIARYNSSTQPVGMISKGRIPRQVREMVTEHTDNDLGMIDCLFQTLNRSWMNVPISAALCTGDDTSPNYLPAMIYVPGKQSIRAEITNSLQTIGVINPSIDVQIAFVGIKASRKVSHLLMGL